MLHTCVTQAGLMHNNMEQTYKHRKSTMKEIQEKEHGTIHNRRLTEPTATMPRKDDDDKKRGGGVNTKWRESQDT